MRFGAEEPILIEKAAPVANDKLICLKGSTRPIQQLARLQTVDISRHLSTATHQEWGEKKGEAKVLNSRPV